MSVAKTQKVIFFISPIGEPNTPVRERADKVLKTIIRPVAERRDYEVFRGDQTGGSSIITNDIIDHIVRSDIVIADLSQHNPNVYYELAIRHALGKPAIQIIEANEAIPFDVRQIRTITFDHKDVESVIECQNSIEQSIRIIEQGLSGSDNPVTAALSLQMLNRSADPVEHLIGEVLSVLRGSEVLYSGYDRITASLANIERNLSLYNESAGMIQRIQRLESELSFYQRLADERGVELDYFRGLVSSVVTTTANRKPTGTQTLKGSLLASNNSSVSSDDDQVLDLSNPSDGETEVTNGEEDTTHLWEQADSSA